MKRKRFTEGQIIGVLKESEAGAKTDDICRRHPPRKLQSKTYTGPVTPSGYRRFRHVRDQLEQDGVRICLPTGK
jgi:hypothetical protein